MNTGRVLPASIILTACLFSANSHSDFSHQGEIVVVKNYSSSSDIQYNESWTWFQVSNLSGVAGCTSADEGSGDLTYLALPDSERYMKALVLSASLNGKRVSVLADESNLYQGHCRVKQLALVPASS